MNLQQLVIDKASEIGIDKIGFTSADPFEELKPRLEAQRANNHHSGFEHQNIEERVYPELIFENPKSIISIALAYPSVMRNKPKKERGVRRGEFARASWGEDYHFILRDKMNELIAYIQEVAGPEAMFKPMVDTGELVDVAVAERAGLGFIGRNGLLITEEYGSYVYLGEIITNLDFEQSETVPFGCGDCMRCIDGCPTNALLGDGRINAKVCLSYQTQTKDYLEDKFRRKIGHVIYGCDICQMVCPYNIGIDNHFHERMEPEPESVNPVLEPILTISNREFKDQFGHLAGSWRGKKPIQRNAIIALANYRDRSSLPTLLQLIEQDPRPMIRGTAAWAVSKVLKREYNPEIINFLEQAFHKEDDERTIFEMNRAINTIKENEQRVNRKS
ncbi:MAG TPA: tRNA epoxyqueuosine(34) reductase QueG [Alloiococcus sp.]|nr:tRNA epoxyqueuosine(34) reductase QueG [Alloiococcus sp.]